jgi:S-adenosylmethionine decarboxylase
MQGLHLTADLYKCRCEQAWLTDAERLGNWCMQAVRAVGLEPVNNLFHNHGGPGAKGGVTATVLLAKSHVCIHTWPQQRGVTVDVYASGIDEDRCEKARGLMLALVERFQPEWTEQRSLDRGDDNA